jgi:peptidoglycan/LPS O-acetylase OafA/YrhL
VTLLAPAPERESSAGKTGKDGVRADIQALRALAVASVMLYHLWPNLLTGGYVGVDVFFAISGFLITSHLLAEVDATGSLRPGRFWARRAKRLVPASATVLLLTGVSILIWVPNLYWRQYFREIIASTLQVQNWLLAHNSVDYLASENSPSPTQHFWTLSAEEQFYVALPLMLLAASLIAGALKLHRRRTILAILVPVVACSLGYSVWLTATTPGVAYFSTATRAWEFGAGALLAFVRVPRRAHRAVRLYGAVLWLGVAAIVTADFAFTAKTAFPSYSAVLPVVGTVLVIWAGRDSAVSRIGAFPPVALLGRVSYAAYLWHWPIIVLLPFITHRPLGTPDKLVILAAVVLLAWLSTTLIEDPIRFGPRLLGGRRPLVVGAWCGAAMATVIGFSATTAHIQAVRDRHSATLARLVVSEMPRCLGAQSMDPALAPCHNPDLDGVLLPDPAQARADDANMVECWGKSHGVAKVCSLGPDTGYRKRLFAVGDSHNNTLIGVYRRIAEDNNWRIDVAGNAGCYLSTARQVALSDAGWSGCEAWRSMVAADARQGGYDAIIVTHSARDRPVIPGPGETLQQATVRGLVEAWRDLPDVPIVAIRDNPAMTKETMRCVIDHGSTAAESCALPRSVALANFDGQTEAAREVPRAHVIDLTALYCTAAVCPPVIGNVLVYRDNGHITATYAATLTPYIERQVVADLSASQTRAR